MTEFRDMDGKPIDLATWEAVQRELARVRGELAAANAATGRVRAIHTPIPGENATQWCSVCSQDEEQPMPAGWWVPWPCPTLTALDAAVPEPEERT